MYNYIEYTKNEVKVTEMKTEYNPTLDLHIVTFDKVNVVLKEVPNNFKSDKKLYQIASDLSKLTDAQVDELLAYQNSINKR